MIYVASPYSSKYSAVRDQRFELVREFVADRLLIDREPVFSPIVYAHDLAQAFSLPFDAAFWRRFNMHMLRRASAVYVLCLDGWVSSIGVSEEIQMAKDLGIPVHYYDQRGILITGMESA